ncbi:hypothetical protein M1146_06145, partial [Patescibacteria group bacterium]|nr:hypothetical protein [Patescibacteria group bacterium]
SDLVGTQKAAIEGYFSPDNVSHMRSLLINNLRYSEGEIEFTGTTVRRERGEYLEGTLSVPSGRLWVLPLLGEDGPDRIFSYSKIMSEYIPNE